MSRLDDNLAFAYKAVEYAKLNAPRSANQTYLKGGCPMKDKVRHAFLLGATRGSDVLKYEAEPDQDMKQRREAVAGIMTSTNLSVEQKRQVLDGYIRKWGKDYFWNASRGLDHLSRGQKLDLLNQQFGLNLSWEQFTKLPKEKQEYYLAALNMKHMARSASRFGVGNCDEKAQLAAEYITEHNPVEGRNLACCILSPRHGGYTGWISKIFGGNGGGDHVFLVYDLERQSRSVRDWGDNAVVIDGWMNDAYPVKQHLKWKYGYNYKGKRINLKQLTVRNMVCVSYANHIDTRYLWTLPKGTVNWVKVD